jgi:molecular chaperone DnaJ
VKDPYEVLGLQRNATQADIKSAFRRQGAKHHPDRNPDDPGAVQRFKEINAGYQILSDPKKRTMFDRFGAAGLGAARGQGPFGGMPIDLSQIKIDGIFGDLLDALGITFGERGDLRLDLEIDFNEAAFGCNKKLNYDRVVTCAACGGQGAAKPTDLIDCDACNGRGRVRYQQGVFPIAVERTCSACHGSGRKVHVPCDDCAGVGLRTTRSHADVTVPPGVESGSTRNMAGKGNMVRGRKSGDLEVTIKVRPHALFRRAGDNVVCQLPVTFAQAVLGDEIEIPTLNGKGMLRVPPGTQPGTVLRIRGKGIPKRVVGGRGDLLVEVVVEIPTQLNDKQRALVMQLADELGESVQPQRRSFVEKLRDLFN